MKREKALARVFTKDECFQLHKSNLVNCANIKLLRDGYPIMFIPDFSHKLTGSERYRRVLKAVLFVAGEQKIQHADICWFPEQEAREILLIHHAESKKPEMNNIEIPSYCTQSASTLSDGTLSARSYDQSVDLATSMSERTGISETNNSLLASLCGVLECPLCRQTLHEPISMPCGHSFCKHCIETYIGRGFRNCPLQACRNVLAEPTTCVPSHCTHGCPRDAPAVPAALFVVKHLSE